MAKTVNEAQRQQPREYTDYLRRKIEMSRKDKAAGNGFSNEEIEAEFSAVRSRLAR